MFNILDFSIISNVIRVVYPGKRHFRWLKISRTTLYIRGDLIPFYRQIPGAKSSFSIKRNTLPGGLECMLICFRVFEHFRQSKHMLFYSLLNASFDGILFTKNRFQKYHTKFDIFENYYFLTK